MSRSAEFVSGAQPVGLTTPQNRFGQQKCPTCQNNYSTQQAAQHAPGSADCLDAKSERDWSQSDA